MEKMLQKEEILFLDKNCAKSSMRFAVYLLLSNTCVIDQEEKRCLSYTIFYLLKHQTLKKYGFVNLNRCNSLFFHFCCFNVYQWKKMRNSKTAKYIFWIAEMKSNSLLHN